jgi:hypothetical protein
MRRSLAVLASIGLGLGAVALATPAHAATTNPSTIYVGCIVDPSAPPSEPRNYLKFAPNQDLTGDLSDTSVTGVAGDTLTVEYSGEGCQNAAREAKDVTLTYYAAPVVSVTFTSVGDSEDLIMQVSASIDATSETENVGSVNLNLFSISGGGGDDSGSSGASGSAPASVIQQFGLPASGNCEDGVTDAMNWSGIGMDGWGISWAQWMNEGAGGAVCTRTVVYDTSTAKWAVS